MKSQWLLVAMLALAGACSRHEPKETVCRKIAHAAGPCSQAACDSETRNWMMFPVEKGAPCGTIGYCDGRGKCRLP